MIKNKKRIKVGKNMQKILYLLSVGAVIGLSGSPTKAYFLIKRIPKDLAKINEWNLRRTILNLYRSKLVEAKENPDGTQTLVLTEKGKQIILTYNINELKFPKRKVWDGYWRVIIFDIPEKLKRARDAVSLILKQAGAYPLQKSVFIYPYDCKNELEFLIEFYNLRKYVRTFIAKEIDNELHLKKIFNLL